MPEENDVFDDIEGVLLQEARKIYSQEVIDHFVRPRNFGVMEDADAHTFMSGICGDTIGIYIGLENGCISKISFVTDGCGPTIACASCLTCMATGLAVEGAKRITAKDLIHRLGGLPLEHTHCAELAVNSLRGALEKLS